MPFTEEDKLLIKGLRTFKHYGARRLRKEFPTKQWSQAGLNKLLKKIDTTGTVKRCSGSGRPRSVRTPVSIDSVEELVLSQEGHPQTHRTVRQIARETSVHRSSVHRIIKRDLALKCLKKKRAHELTEANKAVRLTRAKQLLKKYPDHMVSFIWFTDEKLFTVASPSNSQNDRVYVGQTTKKRHVDAARLLRTRPNFSQSVMVSVGVSSLGCTRVHFLDPGTKINGDYYRNTVLTQMLLPDIRHVSGTEFFVFQQDSAPAHRAKDTVALLKTETPDFIPPTLWPPNSPDLNPVDYCVWSVLQERVYRTKVDNVVDLKQRIVAEWAALDHSVIASAIAQWRLRLRACVRAGGGHFEHCLQ